MLRKIVVPIIMALLASTIMLVSHEGGHALVGNMLGVATDKVQFFWLNIERDASGQWNPPTWESWMLGANTFGSVTYNENDYNSTTEREQGWIDLMGSGTTTVLSLIALASLYFRKDAPRFSWFTFFLVLVGIVDMFTYAVIPMIGKYVTLVNPEQVFNVSCEDAPSYPKIPQPQPPFEPRIQTDAIYCDKQYKEVTISLRAQFDAQTEIKSLTYLFFEVETPQSTHWYVRKYSTSSTGNRAPYGYLHYLPGPIDLGRYRVKQAFLVLNGLPRLIFLPTHLEGGIFAIPEPLYGATKLNINPFLFMGIVTGLSLLQGWLLVRYVIRYRLRQLPADFITKGTSEIQKTMSH
jgi:hypothetical protein